MQFLLTAYDAKDAAAAERRTRARERHLVRGRAMVDSGQALFGTAILDDQGADIGSMLVVEFPSRVECDAWLETEPYVVDEVWADILVEPCRSGPALTAARPEPEDARPVPEAGRPQEVRPEDPRPEDARPAAEEEAPAERAAAIEDSPAGRRFEDYVPGLVHTHGTITVTEEEILGFARRFDPQPIHTDPRAARRGPFGGLIASGWHTTALMMRLYADHYLAADASLASPGVDELRWLLPVRPGDVLSVRATVEGSRPSRSKPDRGLVRTRVEVLNQRDETVMTMTIMNMLLRRNPV